MSAEPRNISFREHVFSCDAISKERISDTDYLAKQESNQAPTAETEHSMFPLTCVNLSTDMQLIPLEVIHSSRDSIRKARESFLIDLAGTLEPHGLNRRDEL